MQKSVSVYVHFDFTFFFLCWYLAFFKQLIIIVLCSFDSRQFPEINGKKQTNQLLFPKRGGWCTAGCCQSVAAARWERLWQTEAIYGEDDSPDRSCSSIFNHVDEFFYSPKSGVISIQMKSGA